MASLASHLASIVLAHLMVVLQLRPLCMASDFSGVVCQPDYVSVAQSRCDNGNFRMLVTYNFSRSCNSSLQGSVTLPLPKRLPCACPPGEGVQPDSSECAPCLPGRYGVGGRIIDDWKQWYNKDVPGFALEMSTFCETPALQADLKCTPWTPDSENSYLFVRTDPSVIGTFVLETTIHVTSAPAKVHFTFFVDAGQCFYDDMAESMACNGLAFYIDSTMVMPVTSQQLTWAAVDYNIAKNGYHQLRWVFRQMNVKSLSNRKQLHNEARIQRIVLEGVPGDATCHKCAPGSFTSSSKQMMCQKCPPYSYQNETGSDHCRSCPSGKYSLTGSTYCFNLPPCTAADVLTHLDTINKCYADKGKFPVVWVRKEWFEWQRHYGYDKPFCEPSTQTLLLANRTVPCNCQPGQQFLAFQNAHTTPICVDCHSGSASPDGVTCLPCPGGSITRSTQFYKLWPQLPPAFSSKCSGKCDHMGWIPSGDHIRTGYSVGTYDSTLTWKEFTIEKSGFISFYCSINCTLRSEIRLPQTNLPAKSKSSIRPDSAKKLLAPTNQCHLEILILNDNGVFLPWQSCSPTASRDGTLFHHQYNLPQGNYSALWSYHQVDPYERKSVGFEARLFNISVTGTKAAGGAYQCVPCRAGYYEANNTQCAICKPGTFSSKQSPKCHVCENGFISEKTKPLGGATFCEPCPGGYYERNHVKCLPCKPGTYSKQGSSDCTQCPDGYFSDQAGSSECLKCGDGTMSDSTHTGCNANCMRTFYAPVKSSSSGKSEMRNLTYNFSPLGNPSQPMYNATRPGLGRKRFYVNLCTTSHDTSSCTYQNNITKTPIPTMACMEDCSSGSCISYNFGKTIGFKLSADGHITLEVTNGDPCTNDPSKHRTALIHLICNDKNGTGVPVIRPPNNESCLLEYDWVTQYACPICTEECYERQETSCGNNGHKMVKRVRIQPCWGGTVPAEGHENQKCYLTYVVVGSIVVVIFILLVVFFILRMHHERVKSTREVYTAQLRRHLYRLSTAAADDEDYEIDSDDDKHPVT